MCFIFSRLPLYIYTLGGNWGLFDDGNRWSLEEFYPNFHEVPVRYDIPRTLKFRKNLIGPKGWQI